VKFYLVFPVKTFKLVSSTYYFVLHLMFFMLLYYNNIYRAKVSRDLMRGGLCFYLYFSFFMGRHVNVCFNVHHHVLQCTSSCTTMYYNVHHHVLQCTSSCTTMYMFFMLLYYNNIYRAKVSSLYFPCQHNIMIIVCVISSTCACQWLYL
jgi:hypothetical protein